MSSPSPQATIVLCFGLNELIYNDSTSPKGRADFNGSLKLDDPSYLEEHLLSIQEKCRREGVRLVVQVISAKRNYIANYSTDQVAKHFHEWLSARDRAQTRYLFNSEDHVKGRPSLYYCSYHGPKSSSHHDGVKLYLYNNLAVDDGWKMAPFKPTVKVMPAIHVCHKNGARGKTCKVSVMKSIQGYLGIRHNSNMILIDSTSEHCTAAAKAGFSSVDGSSLRRLKGTSMIRRHRAMECVMEQLSGLVDARLASTRCLNRRKSALMHLPSAPSVPPASLKWDSMVVDKSITAKVSADSSPIQLCIDIIAKFIELETNNLRSNYGGSLRNIARANYLQMRFESLPSNEEGLNAAREILLVNGSKSRVDFVLCTGRRYKDLVDNCLHILITHTPSSGNEYTGGLKLTT